MNNFGAKLAELLERKAMLQSELSRISGINDALISRWVNGQQRFVDPEDLESICIHVSTNPKDRAELVRAHLLDELPVCGAELIEIRIHGHAAQAPDVAAYRSTLPLNIQRALEMLGREAVQDSDVRSVIVGLAEMLSKSRQEQEQLRLNAPSSAREYRTAAVADATAKLGKYPKRRKSAGEPPKSTTQ